MNMLDFLGRNNLTSCDEIMSHTVSHTYYNDSSNSIIIIIIIKYDNL